MQFNHDESNPFCPCADCEAELEQALQASIVRRPLPAVEQQWNANTARQAARIWSQERLEGRIAALEQRIAALEERIGE